MIVTHEKSLALYKGAVLFLTEQDCNANHIRCRDNCPFFFKDKYPDGHCHRQTELPDLLNTVEVETLREYIASYTIEELMELYL